MPERILVVDDEEAIGRMLKTALSVQGYRVDAVPTGKAALEAISSALLSGGYHLALVDIRLPDTTGIELVRRFLEVSPHTQVVIMTGHASFETAVQALELGAFAYLNKPIELKELYSTVKRSLEKQRLLAENRRLMAELKESNRLLTELNRSLEKRVAERTREIQTINEITGAVASSLKLDRIFRVVNREIKKLIDFDRASVALAWGSDRINKVYFLEPPADPETAGGVSYPLKGTGIEKVIRGKKPLIREDITAEGDYVEDEFIRNTGARSGIVIPLIRRGEAIGTLNLGSLKPGAYDKSHADILARIAGQLAVAIDNANLFRQLERHSRGLEEEVARRTASLESSLAELKEAQEKLIQSEKLAAVAKLVSGVAHEIKNPLNSMRFATVNIENICEKAEDPRKAGELIRESISILKSDIEGLKEMVDRFVAFARPELSPREETDVNSLVREVLRGMKPEIKARKVRLKGKYASGLPPVRLEKGEFRRAIRNLLLNALEAVEDGGRIAVETVRSDNRVRVKIEDDGRGIPPAIREKVFDIFFTTKSRGSGLGLSQVFRAADIHHGGVSFSPRPGGGTVFRLEIPLEERR